MEHKTLKAYGTTVEIYKYTVEEIAEKKVITEGTGVVEGTYLADLASLKRVQGNYYGEGMLYEDNKVSEIVSIVAEGVDDKQMMNLLVSEGCANNTVRFLEDGEKVSIKEKKTPVRRKSAKVEEKKEVEEKPKEEE